MRTEKYKVGLIGYGNGGKFFHAPFVELHPGFELTAIVTSRKEALDLYPHVELMSSVEEMVADQAIDLIVVASPHRLHASHAKVALEAGKHVVVEKPLAETAGEISMLSEIARTAERLLIVYQNRRWDGNYLTVKKIIESGVLGQVYYFESHWSLYIPRLRGVWRENPNDLGGILYDLGPHMIDQAIQLFGKPGSVYARIETHRPGNRVDDFYQIQIGFEIGVQALVMADLMTPISGPRFQVRGTLGTYEKYGHDPQEAALRSGEMPVGDRWGVDDPKDWGRLIVSDWNGLVFDGQIATERGDYRGFYQAVYEAIQSGVSPIELGDITLQLQVIEAAIQSAKTNSVVQID